MKLQDTDDNQTVALVFQYDLIEDEVKTRLYVDTQDEEIEISPITDEEQILRDKSEKAINEDLAASNNVGVHLQIIKSKKLFRSTHRSFEKYCEEVFGISRVHANRKIDAHVVQEILKSEPIGSVSIPTTESQARAMANLSRPDIINVAKTVKELVGDGKPTAKDFEKARMEVCPPATKPTRSKQKTPKTKVQPVVCDPPNTAGGKDGDVTDKHVTSPPSQPKSNERNIITPAQYYPDAPILSLTELSVMAEKLSNIFNNSNRRKESGTLLFKLKAHLEMYAKWEKEQLSRLEMKQAA